MNKNLVSLNKLKKVAKQNDLMKYIKDIGYSNVKDKKYYVITIDNKKVNFGYIKMEDYLIHHDKERRKKFKERFRSLFEKFKYDYNKSIF